MPSMLCTFEACSAVINAGDRVQPGPLPPCPTCGQVNFWPPTAPENALKKRGALDSEFERKLHQEKIEIERKMRIFREQKSNEPPAKQAPALPPDIGHIVTDCPHCNRALRLPYSQAGRIARCPRRDCGASFPWNPGQEIIGFDGWCSDSPNSDPLRFSVTFVRPKGSSASFSIQVIEKGTGHIDRTAAGNNYDEITQHGQIAYDRRLSGVPAGQINVDKFSCPWCPRKQLVSCSGCAALLCSHERARPNRCVSCGGYFGNHRMMEDTDHLQMRGASFTPNKPTGAGNNSPSLMDRLRKRLGGGA